MFVAIRSRWRKVCSKLMRWVGFNSDQLVPGSSSLGAKLPTSAPIIHPPNPLSSSATKYWYSIRQANAPSQFVGGIMELRSVPYNINEQTLFVWWRCKPRPHIEDSGLLGTFEPISLSKPEIFILTDPNPLFSQAVYYSQISLYRLRQHWEPWSLTRYFTRTSRPGAV